jgi:curli biogenesis system outer membrane secretion channel CsgG
MLKTSISVAIFATLAAFVPPGQASAQGSASNLSGAYRCSPEPAQCQAPTFSISQTGQTLEIKAENGPIAEGKMTSDITVSAGPPWNSIGIVMSDRSIQWSSGTHCRKQ